MWQKVLLGKLAISIVASLAAGGICIYQPWSDQETTWAESAQWVGIGVFFLLLGTLQLGVIGLLLRRR